MMIKREFILYAFLVGLLSFSSCDENNSNCLEGEGTITTSILDVENFTGIASLTSSNVTINQGTTQKVEATGHPNIIEIVSTSVSSGIWEIRLDQQNKCLTDFELSFAITVPTINHLTLSGSGDVVVNNFSNQNNLTITSGGSGSMTLKEFEGITNLEVTLTGSGDFSGRNAISTLELLNLIHSGSGDYLGYEISSNRATVTSLGSGDCQLTVQDTMDVRITGSGDVLYKGMPVITENITGSGRLRSTN